LEDNADAEGLEIPIMQTKPGKSYSVFYCLKAPFSKSYKNKMN
jgi:hypothetical protein